MYCTTTFGYISVADLYFLFDNNRVVMSVYYSFEFVAVPHLPRAVLDKSKVSVPT